MRDSWGTSATDSLYRLVSRSRIRGFLGNVCVHFRDYSTSRGFLFVLRWWFRSQTLGPERRQESNVVMAPPNQISCVLWEGTSGPLIFLHICRVLPRGKQRLPDRIQTCLHTVFFCFVLAPLLVLGSIGTVADYNFTSLLVCLLTDSLDNRSSPIHHLEEEVLLSH